MACLPICWFVQLLYVAFIDRLYGHGRSCWALEVGMHDARTGGGIRFNKLS